jgi:putative nucleotide binding protein
MEKEEKAIILDFLPYGYPLEGKTMPLAQALGMKHFTLLQLVPRRNMTLQLKEEVYIGNGKRDKIYYILGRLPPEKLTETAKIQLQEFVTKSVAEQAARFADFFNKAEPINTRLHQLELLPGFGIKHTKAILDERDKKPFASFDDIRKRLHSIPDPRKAIEKRILEELEHKQRYNLFIS